MCLTISVTTSYINRHEHGECTCNDLKPVHMFVSGVGGTGKSYLIDTIRAKVSEIWKSDTNNGEIVQLLLLQAW